MIQEIDIKHMNELLEHLGIEFVPTIERDEAQFLEKILAQYLDMSNNAIKQYKAHIAMCYEMADDQSEFGRMWFQNLNLAKDSLRALRRRTNKLASIQHKIKQLSK